MTHKTMSTTILIMVSSIVLFSSNNWVGMWMSLEMNMLFFIPLMISQTQDSLEASMKYFFIQATSSLMLMFMMIFMKFELLTSVMMMPLLMKLGITPFHMWVTKVNLSLNYKTSIMFLTWQKLAPLIMLIIWMNKLLMFILLMLLIIPSLSGLNQNKMKLIMAFSSIFQSIWILMSLSIKKSMGMKYFLMYTMMTASIIMMLMFMNVTSTNLLINMKNKLLTTFTLMMMSLAGIPPFSGFIMKWIMLMELAMMKMMTSITLMLAYSTLNIYFYLQPMFLKMMNTNTIWVKSKITKTKMLTMIILILPLMMYL